MEDTSSVITIPNQVVEQELKEDNKEDNYRNYYEIFVSSFADSNEDGIGDLNGITSKLSYLRDLGYTGLYLTPIFKSPTYHKYDCSDYFTIDSDFGTMDDLKNLVKEAHNKGMKVILDGVFNHTGNLNKWFEAALVAHRKKLSGQTLTQQEEKDSSLYVFYDSLEEAESSKTTYYKAGGNDFYYEANFSSNMPELNFDSDYTYEKIQSVIDYYMDDAIDVDGFRLDATSYYYLDQTEKNIKVLNKINEMVKNNKEDGYVIGECFKGKSVIESYITSDIDSFFYFPMSNAFPDSFLIQAVNQNNKRKYLNGLLDLVALNENSTTLPALFLSNHDMKRVTKYKGEEQNKFMIGLLGLLTGNTFTYYGEEIGMNSANDSPTSDANYRTHYFWDDETHEMECDNPEGSSKQEETYPDSKTQLLDSNSLLNYQKKVNLLRNSLSTLKRGSYDTSDSINTDTSSPLLVINKTEDDQEIKILINFSKEESVTYDLDDASVVSTLVVDNSNPVVYTSGEKKAITLSPYSIVLLNK